MVSFALKWYDLGFKEGFEKGFKQGLAKVKQKRFEKISFKMLEANYSIEDISKYTYLTITHINKLMKSIK